MLWRPNENFYRGAVKAYTNPTRWARVIRPVSLACASDGDEGSLLRGFNNERC